MLNLFNSLMNRIPESISLEQIVLICGVIWWWGLVLLSCIPLPPLSFYRRRAPRLGQHSKSED